MPAPRLYIGSEDIARIMGISRREAQYIMKGFALKGQTVAFGRVHRVALRTFARFICEQDGSSETETYNDFKQALKGA